MDLAPVSAMIVILTGFVGIAYGIMTEEDDD